MNCFSNKKFIFILLFMFIFSIIISNLSNQVVSQQKPLQNITIFNNETVKDTGTGPSLLVLEDAWGTKNDYNVKNDTTVDWTIPASWYGKNFSVTVSNLTAKLSNDLKEVADGDYVATSGTEVNGSYLDTRTQGGNSWNLQWGWITRTELNADLFFYTLAYQNSITNLHIHLEISTTNCDNNDDLEIRLMDETSGYVLIDRITSGGSFIIDYDESTSPANYVDSNGRLWLKFFGASQDTSIKTLSIDYAYINVTASREIVDPDTIVLTVNGTNITGDWNFATATLFGFWSPGICSFLFECDNSYSISFNTQTTLWINRSNTASSIYIRGSGNSPTIHYWRIDFNAVDASSSYQNQKFIILHTRKWSFINATGPSGPVSITPGTYRGNSTIPVSSSDYASGNWRFYCSSSNIISNLYIRKNGIDVNCINITDVVNISCDIIEPNIPGNFNLTIFNGTSIVHQELVISSGSNVVFTSWAVANDSNNNGIYEILVTWKNSTAIGYMKKFLTVIYPTDAINHSIGHIYFIGRSINMTIFYNDTFNGNGISGANLSYIIKNSTNPNIENGFLVDLSNGNYTNSISLSGYTMGNYTLIINASKKWYHNISLSFQIEIFAYNTSLNTSLPTINKVGYAYCYYSDTIKFEVNYYNTTNNNMSYIPGASVSIYKNSNPISTVFWQESTINKTYYIYLNSSNSDLVSTWNDINNNMTITVQISKYSFIPRSVDIEFDVRNSTAILNGNSTENKLSGRFDIIVNYTNNLLDRPISDYYSPSFQFMYNGTIYSSLKVNYLYNGLWNLSCIFNETTNVSYDVLIQVSLIGFIDTSWSLTLNIDVIHTINQTFNLTENVYFYHNVNFSIIYNRTYPTLLGLDNAEIISPKYTITIQNLGSGLYTVEIHTAYLLNVSHYKLYFIIKQTHYQQINFSIQFNIINITTNSTIIDSTDTQFDGNKSILFVNESVRFDIEYFDEIKSEFISNSMISVYILNSQGIPISSQFTISSYLTYYSIKIDTFGVNSGNYTLQIILQKQNYNKSILTLNLSIKPYITSLTLIRDHPQQGIIPLTHYIEWHHYQILFMSNFTGIFFNEFTNYTSNITWGFARYIICEKGKDPMFQSNWLRNGTFVYDIQKLYFYTSIIPLEYNNGSYLPVGNYTIYVSNYAKNCINQTLNFSLEIIPRLTGRIEVTQIPTVSVGQNFLIQIQLYVNNIPYSAHLRLIVISKSEDGSIIVNDTFLVSTDSSGIKRKYYQVPQGSNQIIINVEFLGEFRYYPGYSIEPFQLDNPVIIQVEQQFNPLPIILILIIVGIGSISAILYVKRKVIDTKKSKKMEMSLEKFNNFKDLTSIICILIIYKPNNELSYKKLLINKGLDSNYWDKINKTINEFSGTGKRSNAALDVIKFDSVKILIDDGEYIRLALLLEDYPSEMILRTTVDFIQYFELSHYNNLRKSEVNKINDIEDHLNKRFGLSYILPYSIAVHKLTSVKITTFQDTLINMARVCSMDGYFYISDLYRKVIDETLIEGMIIFQTIQELINKRIFVPHDVFKEKSKKLVKKIEEYEKSRNIIDDYRLKIVSLTNKALNAVRKNDYNTALVSYKEAAKLAKQYNFQEEWRRFLFKIEEIKTKIERIGDSIQPSKPLRPEISSKYSVKVKSFSKIKQKIDEQKVLKDQKQVPKKEKVVIKTKISELPPPEPVEIEEIKSILSLKTESKTTKYPEIKIDTEIFQADIEELDEEIESIEKEIKKSEKEKDEALTPLEKALKFGLNLRDEEIFEVGTESIESQFFSDVSEMTDKKDVKDDITPDQITISDLKSICTVCHSKISIRILKLLIKGYEPECENCGAILKLKDLLIKK